MNDWSFGDAGRKEARETEREVLSVTQLVRRLRNVVEIGVGEMWVVGEVSNLKKQASGHWYFSLKDGNGQISCAMFGARTKAGSGNLADGVEVQVFAEATVYEGRGQLQLVVKKVAEPKAGDLQLRFEALKGKLAGEGLFAMERKRAVPKFPEVIGLVTSETGAVIQDLQNVLGRRAPWVRLILVPVRVQGKGAEVEIARAVECLGGEILVGGKVVRCDVLIVGRGGGSMEDLWCFNEEVVARAIAGCGVPVISAVGHESDVTIADFVADLRAPTPSAAAELAVPDREILWEQLRELGGRMSRRSGDVVGRYGERLMSMERGIFSRDGERLLRERVWLCDHWLGRLDGVIERSLAGAGQALEKMQLRLQHQHPEQKFSRQALLCEEWRRRMERAVEQQLGRGEEAVKRAGEMLRALGPEGLFSRGFSITRLADGRVVRSLDDVKEGEELQTMLGDGVVRSRVFEREVRVGGEKCEGERER